MLKIQTGLLATAIVVSSAYSASARTVCDHGYVSARGDCVNAQAVAAARRLAVIFSQPKISQTAYPVLPSSDSSYRYPNQLINIPGSGMTPVGKAQAPAS
jgi:hypothetical protein